MQKCPYCQAEAHQMKAGRTEAGSQRYRLNKVRVYGVSLFVRRLLWLSGVLSWAVLFAASMVSWGSRGAGASAVDTPTPLPARYPNAQWEPVVQAIGDMNLVYVPAGCFLMGSSIDEDDERPVHEVCLTGFWIGQTEVTNAQYSACVVAGHCRPPYDQFYYENPEYAEHPVVYVNWEQAFQYASWKGCNLPTEAQWEYSARGPESLTYPWGNEFDGSRLNSCDANCDYHWRNTEYNDGYSGSSPVGSFPDGISWAGALDMSGNVWEWVADWYTADYYAQHKNASQNPAGPETGWGRVVRGGSWASYRGYTRSASRDWDSPQLRFVVVGFRIVCLFGSG
jgi:formylglycine-generating enzyme required for sulfatase activity